MDEFETIAQYLAPLAGPEGLGLLDDAALYTPLPGFDLVMTKDTMVEGVHFPNRQWGANTAEKLLRVNLSDLAAKGARPIGYLLSIAWPKSVDAGTYFPAFAKGLKTIQDEFDVSLFGGDTVSIDGPMVVSATLLGLVPCGQMIMRSGGDIGDDVWVSGTIGDAALGLKLALDQSLNMSPSGEAIWVWEEAYFRPKPRLLLRKILRKYATACADVSDGLISDLGHIAKASGIGIEIELEAVPMSKSSQDWINGHKNNRLEALVTAGDDYELVFLARADASQSIQSMARQIGIRVTKIGKAVQGQGVEINDAQGVPIEMKSSGFKHF